MSETITREPKAIIGKPQSMGAALTESVPDLRRFANKMQGYSTTFVQRLRKADLARLVMGEVEQSDFTLSEDGARWELRGSQTASTPTETPQHVIESTGVFSEPEVAPNVESITKAIEALANAGASTEALDSLTSKVDSLAGIVDTTVRANDIRFDAVSEKLDALTGASTVTVELVQSGAVLKTIEGARPELALLVRDIARGHVNFYLWGPAGTGKGHLGHDVAEALDRPHYGQSCSPDMTAPSIIGSADGHGIFHESAFAAMYDKPGIYIYDEIHKVDEEVACVINEALSSGRLFVPRHHDPERRVIHRHPDFVVICTANTTGDGVDQQYGGTRLDTAWKDRFVGCFYRIDYMIPLERALLETRPALAERLWGIRSAIASHNLERVLSTRAFIFASKSLDDSDDEIVKRILDPWQSEEKSKVGE